MTHVDLLSFSMRATPPPAGADWFKIVHAKKSNEPTKVYIYDEIGYWGTNAKDFAALIEAIESSIIELHLNTPGGSVFDALAICATLKGHKAIVRGYVDGMAASAGSFILQACNERYITRNAMVMIHDAKAYAGGNAEQMRKAAQLLDRVSDNIADMYAVRSGEGTVETWRAIMKAGDEWYTGNEALDAGLVDDVVDNPDEDDAPEESKNTWTTKEVEAFLATPPEKLAKVAACTITNRVEEAPTMDPVSTAVPPAAVPPPVPPAAPTADSSTPPTPVPPTPPTPSGPGAAAALVVNGAAAFVVNGVQVTDISAVQSHISALEAFRTDTIKNDRMTFVTQLAKENKISATQIGDEKEGLTAFALSLTPDQYTNWKASFETAPAMSLTAPHGVTPGDQSAPENGVEKVKADQIKDLEYVVQSLKDSGMTQEYIENTDSFKNLQALKTPAS